MNEKSEGGKYTKFAAGVVILRAEHANWNADFSGWPRKLPDGRFYSTDKALKYAIRKYLKEVKNQNVLFWRVYNEKGDIGNLVAMLEKNVKYSPQEDREEKKIVEKAITAIDVKLFGGTFTIKNSNFSITGPVQITYGVDIWGKGHAYLTQIQSPKYEPQRSEKAEKATYGDQSTLGSETRVTEAHYAFDFTINPNNLEKDDFINSTLGKDKVFLTNKDVKMFKEALINAPGYVTSTTKNGVFTELMVFAEFEMKEGSVPLVPILKNAVEIKDADSSEETKGERLKRKIDITKLNKIITDLRGSITFTYYNENLCELIPEPPQTKVEEDVGK